MKIEVLNGSAADAQLADDSFAAQWDALVAACPWATGFQTHAFARSWFGAYRTRYEPIFAIARGAGGSLSGILPLAASLSDGAVGHVGTQQAEYHAWACAPQHGDEFIVDAIDALGAALAGRPLEFKYLPPGAPLNWLKSGMEHRCLLTSLERPLLRPGDGTEIAESLRKSSNKNRLRKLLKFGPMQFRRLTKPAELESLLDEIIRCYDFRHIAMRGEAPFANDAPKRPFHLAMLETSPDLLHVTALTFGDTLATAHLGVCGPKEIELGLMSYNPLLAPLSPGKFHIYYLAQMLLKEGREVLDLTCGGEFYKDRFANGADEVHTLEIYPSPMSCRKAAIRVRTKNAVKRTLRACRVSPAQARAALDRAKRAGPIDSIAHLARGAQNWCSSRKMTRVYVIRPETRDNRIESASTTISVHRDSLDDLMAYQPHDRSSPSQQEFVSDALRRMEQGEHPYTVAENGRLLHITWVGEEASAATTADDSNESKNQKPAKDLVIADVFTLPSARRRGLATQTLRAILRDFTGKHLSAFVPKGNVDAQRILEKVGFVHQRSVFEQVRFGRATVSETILRPPLAAPVEPPKAAPKPPKAQSKPKPVAIIPPPELSPAH